MHDTVVVVESGDASVREAEPGHVCVVRHWEHSLLYPLASLDIVNNISQVLRAYRVQSRACY